VFDDTRASPRRLHGHQQGRRGWWQVSRNSASSRSRICARIAAVQGLDPSIDLDTRCSSLRAI
jgi:hypothetical protein